MRAANRLARALDHPEAAARSVRGLVEAAQEVGAALRAPSLTAADHDRILARSLTLLEQAVAEQRAGWQRILRRRRRVPVVLGGAGAVAVGAVLGWAAISARRQHGAAA